MKHSVPKPSTLNLQPSTSLWLIRHAEVEQRYQGVFGGQIDMELSPRGHEQAAVLADYLHGKHFDALYASPMKRVQQTLAPVLLNGAPRPIVLPDLREINFGDWTGLPFDEVHARFGIPPAAWLDQLESAAIPNAECSATFRTRIEPCLRHILAHHPGQQVAVACHGGVIRMLLSILLDWPLPRLAAFEIGYTSITRVVWQPPKAQLQLLNFTPWREMEETSPPLAG